MNRRIVTVKRVTASILIVAGIAVLGTVAYLNSTRGGLPVFSQNAMLSSVWEQFKVAYIEKSSGRTLDKERDNLTTSEAESFTMLRAVWQDDRTTFDQSLKFTNDILRRPSDGLFSWQFGKLANGNYGVLTEQGGNNTASGADGDIALALVFASQRWQNQAYLDQAKRIITSIWEQEVITVDGKPLLVANNLEKANADSVIVNPSYFSPAAYRIFAKIDPTHDWDSLADASYDWLDRIAAAPALGSSNGLPPNWVRVKRASGEIVPPGSDGLTTEFGYYAMRIPWRLTLDAEWHDNARAKQTLAKMSFLTTQWQSGKQIKAVYAHDGAVTGDFEAPSVYGGILGYFREADDNNYQAVYEAELKALYNPDTQSWRQTLSYYDDTWAWFGLALHEGALVDLSQN